MMFDIFIINSTADYNCYVQATLLLSQSIAQNCSFLQNPDQSKFNMTTYSFQDANFLEKATKYSDVFFIIDNTDFPLFIDDPFQVSSRMLQANYDNLDLYVDVSFNTSYQVSDTYFTMVIILGSVGIFLLVLLAILIIKYSKQKKVYASQAEERRKQKQEIIRLKLEHQQRLTQLNKDKNEVDLRKLHNNHEDEVMIYSKQERMESLKQPVMRANLFDD